VDILASTGLSESVPVMKLGLPYPFPRRLANEFLAQVDCALVVEETDQVIEMFLKNLPSVWGRYTGHVPRAGELVPEVLYDVLSKALTRFNIDWVWDGKPAIVQSRAVDDTGYAQPTYRQLRDVRRTRSIYHNNAIQSWLIAESGEVKNVQLS